MSDLKNEAQRLRGDLVDVIFRFVVSQHGVTNSEIARALGLESQFQGGQRNYLTHALLSQLVQEGRITRSERGHNVIYSAVS